MNNNLKFGIAILIAITLKAAMTVALGFSFDPIQVSLALVVFAFGEVLTFRGIVQTLRQHSAQATLLRIRTRHDSPDSGQ